MKSPSRQCDFVPLEFPDTQLTYPPVTGAPLRIATLLPPAPAHCSSTTGGPTPPFVHWLKVALTVLDAELVMGNSETNKAITLRLTRTTRRCARTLLVYPITGTGLPILSAA